MNIDARLAYIEAALNELLTRIPGQVVTKSDIAQAQANQPQGAMPADQLAFINAIIGMHRMPDTPVRDNNLNRVDAEYLAQYHNGNVPVSDLDVRDAAYFAHMSGPYFEKTRQDIRWAGVVGGTTLQINQFMSLGDNWRNNYPAAEYRGPLRILIARMMGE